ncbi:MAG: acetylglutamate kinase [Alicyclobacillaceae bacterium]|nr:acetylglutamate kinase [Alicyclobacillaceae bacterium]
MTEEVKAAVLVEALPYIQRFAGKTFVIKYGGSAMGDRFTDVILDILWLKQVGIRPVVVHGGGKEITAMLERLGHQARFVEGLRVTDETVMEVVEMVLSGRVNPRLVAAFNRRGGEAVGLSGVDGNLLRVVKKRHPAGDIGFVGEVVRVNTELLEGLLDRHMIPVIAPIGVDEDGRRYNVNADEAAGAIAGALRAEKLFLITDVPGIMRKGPEGLEVVSRITAGEIRRMVETGEIYGGMIPKVQACLSALAAGAKHVHIINGEDPHALLLEVFTDQGIGTMVLPE